MRSVGGTLETGEARNLGGADATSSSYEKERRGIEKTKYHQKRDIENKLESELTTQIFEAKSLKVRKMAAKQGLVQEEIKQNKENFIE